MTSQQRIRHGFEVLRPYVAPEALPAFRALQHTAELDAVAADCLSRYLQACHADEDPTVLAEPPAEDPRLRRIHTSA